MTASLSSLHQLLDFFTIYTTEELPLTEKIMRKIELI